MIVLRACTVKSFFHCQVAQTCGGVHYVRTHSWQTNHSFNTTAAAPAAAASDAAASLPLEIVNIVPFKRTITQMVTYYEQIMATSAKYKFTFKNTPTHVGPECSRVLFSGTNELLLNSVR